MNITISRNQAHYFALAIIGDIADFCVAHQTEYQEFLKKYYPEYLTNTEVDI